MTRALSPRYLLASIALLLVLVLLHTGWAVRRTRQELLKQFEDRGRALAGALEVASRGAVQGNALMEDMIAQRLLDNARLIDRLLLFPPFDPAELPRIAAANRLRRVDLLDRTGAPYAFPSPPMPGHGMGGMMMGRGAMMHDPQAMRAPDAGHPPMMMYLWGRRWGRASGDVAAPPAVQDRKFWEGSLFGIAVAARSFPGIIAVHADGADVLDFRKEVGVERQIEEQSRQAGVKSIALLDGGLRVLAHSDRGRVGTQEQDLVGMPIGAEAATSRLTRDADGREVFEVLKPVSLAGGAPGVLRVRLSTEPMEHAWRRDRDAGILLGLAVVGLGVLGLGAIFYAQHRHLGEVRRLEAGMAQRDRLAALGDMAATVAHEIRNPLNAVSMGLQRLATEFPLPEAPDHERLVTLMRGEVARLNTIVEEFLSLARPVSLSPAPADIAEILADAAALVEAEAKAGGIATVVKAPAGLPPVRLDRDRFKQVLLNLALNAIQAMPDGGTLGMEAAASGRHLTITVTDTGKGIPGDLLPRIFEPYVTTKTRGLGLGLAVARRIVEAHGGRIEAGSAPDRGSRFRVTLPLAGPADG